MGWWNGEFESMHDAIDTHHNKCTECGDFKEVSKKSLGSRCEH